MRKLLHYWANRRKVGHRLRCSCQVVGYLWYADGKVWSLSPDDVEVITDDRRR